MKRKNTSIEIKIRSALFIILTLILVLSISLVSYAWFKDTFDTPNATTVVTGKMDVSITAYKQKTVNEGGQTSTVWESLELYDSTPEEGDAPEQDSALLNTSIHTLDLNDGRDEVYFVVKKTSGSINLDVVLSFIFSSSDAYVSGFAYNLAKIDYNPQIASDLESFLDEETQKEVTIGKPLNSVNNDMIASSMRKDKTEEYVIFRFTCAHISGDIGSNAYTEKTYPINVKFSVGQIGSLDGEALGNTIRVSSETELRNALLSYQTNDSIFVMSDITFNTDLVLDHPVKLYVRGKVLKINGNFNISFAYAGDFLIDTQNSGKIIVAQIGQSGNFVVDIPNAYLSIVGSGNAEAGHGDIYVQNTISISASYTRGINIYRSYIYNTKTASIDDQSTEFKEMYLGSSTLFTVASRTTVGSLIARTGTTLIKVVNSGMIKYANFSGMMLEPQNDVSSPQLIVENYGTVGDGQNAYSVLLNNNARPCYKDNVIQPSGNYRLINRLGATFTQGQNGVVGGISLGNEGEFIYIETDTETIYVAPVEEGDYTNIVVSYANLYDGDGSEKLDTTLAEVLAWHFNDSLAQDATQLQDVVKMKVVCYGNKILTEEDYATICSLSALVELDLSECSSTNYTFGSIKGLTELTKIDLPMDTVLPANAFDGTKIDEVYIPSTYTTFIDKAFAKPTSGEEVLYIHLEAYVLISELMPTDKDNRYLFVATESLVDEYRALTTNDDKGKAIKARIFMEAQRYGDYFIRFEGDADIAVATYVGASFNYTEESLQLSADKNTSFDFSSFATSIGGNGNKNYNVSALDAYSFYNKLKTGVQFDLVMNGVYSIGEYALYQASDISSIMVDSSSLVIGKYAFYNLSNATSIKINVTDSLIIGENAFENATSNTALDINSKTIEIGNKAFIKNTSLKYAYIDGVGTIGDSAFEGQSSLLEVRASGITKVGQKAFNICPKLFAVVMPSLCEMGLDAMSSCDALRYLETSIVHTVTNSTAVSQAVLPTYLQVYKVNTDNLALNEYTTIPNLYYQGAANYFYGLKPFDLRILVSATYQELYNGAASNYFGDGRSKNSKFATINTEYFGEEYYMTVENGVGVKSEPYTINLETGECKLADYAYFYNSEGNIEILIYMHADTGESVSYEEELIVPGSVLIDGQSFTVTNVGPYAFGRNNLYVEKLTFGEGILTLDDYALDFMPRNTGNDVYHHYHKMSTVDLGGIVNVGQYAFAAIKTSIATEMSKDSMRYVTGNSVQTVGNNAFSNCKGLTNVTMPLVQTLADSVFNGCSALVTIDMSNVLTLGNNTFSNCTSLYSVALPNVTTMGTTTFSSCTNLRSAYCPKLKVCTNPFNSCTNFVRLDMGLLAKGSTLVNTNPSVGRFFFVHVTEEDVVSDYILSCGSKLETRKLFIPEEYKSMFDANYGQIITYDKGGSMANVGEYYDPNNPVTIYDYKVPNFYYYKNANGTVDILDCNVNAGAKLRSNGDIFNIPDGNNSFYDIEEIANCAYLFVNIEMPADELVFPDTIKKLGDYAFSENYNMDSSSNGNTGTATNTTKTFGAVNLSNVEYLGAFAFFHNEIVHVKGYAVKTMGDATFAYNTSLQMVELPLWESETPDKLFYSGYHFRYCSALKLAYIGPRNNVTRGSSFANSSVSLIILNDPQGIAKGNDNIGSASVIIKGAKSDAFKDTLYPIYPEILACGELALYGTDDYTIQIPTMLYSINGDNTASVLKYMLKTVPETDTYTVPARLTPAMQTVDSVQSAQTFSFLGENIGVYDSTDSETGRQVTAIDAYAYTNVSFGTATLNTGKYVTYIGAYAFANSNVQGVILQSVETVDNRGFNSSKIQNLTANNLKTIGQYAFAACLNLIHVNLPAIETIGDRGFTNNSNTLTINLGENLKQLKNCFHLNNALQEVIIRAPIYLKSDGGAFQNSIPATAKLYVPTSTVDSYRSDTSWNAFADENIIGFEKSAQIDGITYFFNVVNGNQAEISLIKVDGNAVLSGTFTFPSEFVITENEVETTYSIVKINSAAYSVFDNYDNVSAFVLPNNLKVFDNSAMPSRITSLDISENNEYFATEDGVLYNKDKTMIICWPKAKPVTDVVIADTVKIIAENAFLGNLVIERITFNGDVVINTSAFEGCYSLSSVTFKSTTPSLLVGKDIFNGCNASLVITVPAGTIENYKKNVYVDISIAEKMVELA